MAISNVFELCAAIRLDSSEYEKGLKDAERQSSVFGDVLKANLVTKGIDVAIAGFKKLTSASVGFIRQSVGAYGEYQQLVGGVETLFGESSEAVMENARNAFKTAGVSANEYMATVTSFAASLVQSTKQTTSSGEEAYAKAAELADMALADMSDKMSVRLKRVEPYQGCGVKRPQEMAA